MENFSISISHLSQLLASYNIYFFITALNPAQFLENNPILALVKTDSNYTEVIHTEITKLGIVKDVGHVDFYPNGGVDQPGCKDDDECSHKRAWELFAASLTHGRFTGNRCANLKEARSNKPCTGFTLHLGTNDMIKYG